MVQTKSFLVIKVKINIIWNIETFGCLDCSQRRIYKARDLGTADFDKKFWTFCSNF